MVTHPAKPYGHLNVSYWKTTGGKFYFNISVEYFEDLGKQKNIIQIFRPTTTADEKCETLFLGTSYDNCRRLNSNAFMRMFLDGFYKGTDQRLSTKWQLFFEGINQKSISDCTSPKGTYTSTNMTFDENLFLPIRETTKFRIVFKFLALRNKKYWIELYTAHIRGIYEGVLKFGRKWQLTAWFWPQTMWTNAII